MRCGLCQLFDMMDAQAGEAVVPHGDGDDEFRLGDEQLLSEPDIALISGQYVPPTARRLRDLCANAFDSLVHAWMSEFPIDAEMLRFGRKVLAAQNQAEAERLATDHGDPDVRIVAEAAYKVQHEIHRLQGLLRFNPNKEGVYVARCEPDHLTLLALGGYFSLRFGETPWAIIDEKRRLCLNCPAGQRPTLTQEASAQTPECSDEWESLWRQYHTTINNESRSNPALQRQFMPKRYWKYLPEM